jgi:predicted RNA polymerase sigma factor
MLDELDPALVAGYQPYWVVRAHCLRGTGADAARAAQVALGLTEDPALRAHLAGALTDRGDPSHPPRASSGGPPSPG